MWVATIAELHEGHSFKNPGRQPPVEIRIHRTARIATHARAHRDRDEAEVGTAPRVLRLCGIVDSVLVGKLIFDMAVTLLYKVAELVLVNVIGVESMRISVRRIVFKLPRAKGRAAGNVRGLLKTWILTSG